MMQLASTSQSNDGAYNIKISGDAISNLLTPTNVNLSDPQASQVTFSNDLSLGTHAAIDIKSLYDYFYILMNVSFKNLQNIASIIASLVGTKVASRIPQINVCI